MIETICRLFEMSCAFVLLDLFLTASAGSLFGVWPAHPLYGVIIILSISKIDLYRILMAIMTSINALILIYLTVVINLDPGGWESYKGFEILEIGATTVLLASSLIRIRGLLKKWRAWIIPLMIINAFFLLFLVKDAATAAMSV